MKKRATWKPHEKHGELTERIDLPESVFAFLESWRSCLSTPSRPQCSGSASTSVEDVMMKNGDLAFGKIKKAAVGLHEVEMTAKSWRPGQRESRQQVDIRSKPSLHGPWERSCKGSTLRSEAARLCVRAVSPRFCEPRRNCRPYHQVRRRGSETYELQRQCLFVNVTNTGITSCSVQSHTRRPFCLATGQEHLPAPTSTKPGPTTVLGQSRWRTEV